MKIPTCHKFLSFLGQKQEINKQNKEDKKALINCAGSVKNVIALMVFELSMII